MATKIVIIMLGIVKYSIIYRFFNVFARLSEEFTVLPVVLLVLLVLGVELPPLPFHISYSTLEAKKSAACSTETIDVFCLDDSTLLKK
jgi:hypothetical protein